MPDQTVRELIAACREMGAGVTQIKSEDEDGTVLSVLIVLTGEPKDNALISAVVEDIAGRIADGEDIRIGADDA